VLLFRGLILGIAGSLALLQVSTWATTPTVQLRTAIDEVIRILDDPSLQPAAKTKERQARVRAAVSDLFDYHEIGRRVLGQHWRPLSELEREEFVSLFRALLEHSYLPKIALYKGEQVRFLGESVDGDLATVRTLLITRNGKEIPVTYRLGRRDGRWLIFDILVEGVSLSANYRSQFNQIIQTSSYRELVRKMKNQEFMKKAS